MPAPGLPPSSVVPAGRTLPLCESALLRRIFFVFGRCLQQVSLDQELLLLMVSYGQSDFCFVLQVFLARS